jgi:CRP/FNR family cyclic AMP-dependent transcriptional regulator
MPNIPAAITTGSLTTALLGEIPLLCNLTPAELQRLKGFLHARSFPADTNLITVEQPGEVVYIILSGTVKVHVEQAAGSDVILAILGPGEVVGEMSLVDRAGRSANVVTMEESTLIWLDRTTFWDCLQSMPALTYSLASMLSRRLRVANAQIQSLATHDVFGRVARQLLVLADEYGQPAQDGSVRIPIRLTQSDIAGLIGATRVRVNQVLAWFKERGHISVDHDYRITIHNSEALAQRCL